ncbi:MAG TPA: hypothetical protein DD490_24770 [Acidobacteria bacterium]|nr:hypothetical protein [Acidobacteriota bacterium]
MTRHHRPLLMVSLLLLLLGLGACFEPPVLETLDLRFLRDGSFVVTSTVEVADADEKNQALARRMERVRQELETGSDAWGGRFASLEPVAERFAWEKQLGEIRRGTRSAVADEPRKLGAFFGDTSLAVSYEIRDGVAELSISPGAAGRATRRQRDVVEQTLETWSGDVAAYLREAGALWAYLDEHPDRAHSCLGTLFSDLLTDDVRAGLDPLDEDEQKRVKRLEEAMEKVMAVLLVAPGEDHSPDELSHLVYDPFPARLVVRLPGRPLERPEGFEVAEGGKALVAVGPGLWEALRSLEGRWLAPDPVLLYVRNNLKEPKALIDLDALAATPRRADPVPTADEVWQEIEGRLRPASLYQVAFAVEPDAEVTAEEIGWTP